MNLPALRRYAVAGILAATMGVLGAPPAEARQLGTASQAWQWAQKAWSAGVYTLWSRIAMPAPRPQGVVEKEGWGLDPNGAPAPAPACGYCNDLGPGIDPNG